MCDSTCPALLCSNETMGNTVQPCLQVRQKNGHKVQAMVGVVIMDAVKDAQACPSKHAGDEYTVTCPCSRRSALQQPW